MHRPKVAGPGSREVVIVGSAAARVAGISGSQQARAVLAAIVLMLIMSIPADASAPLVFSGSRSVRAVGLTFDDGWGRHACARIATTLRRNHVKGTFFINGVHLQKAPSKWRRILDGMPVGNHTRSHPNLVKQAASVVRQQIRTNEVIHEQLLRRPMLKLFRPPFGASNALVRRIAGGLGYRRTVIWNTDTFDWRSSATVGSVIARATGAPPGSIILMHCGPGVTPAALPAIIRHYRARGIRMVGLVKLLRL